MEIVETIPLTMRVLHVVRLIIASVVRLFCKIYYGNREKIPPIADAILKLPAVEVAKKIRTKEVTSVAVLEACIRRIKDVNPTINCIVEDRFDLAMKEAKKADELIRSGTKTPEQLEKELPFLGVPYTTKDSFAIKGLHNTAGVYHRKDLVADSNAEVIRLLEEKGAIVIAVTNIPEMCYWWESHNHIYGRSRNPYNTTRIVGGSSGGEGGSQAAACSIFGIGSDIGGSIRMPGFANGIFGHKPSKHLVSVKGHYPTTDTEMQLEFVGMGPMTRYAVDLKPIMKIIAGENAKKLRLDEPVDLKKVNFFYQFKSNVLLMDSPDPDIIAAMKKVVEYLKLQHKIDAKEKKIAMQSALFAYLQLLPSEEVFGECIMKNYSTFNCIKELAKSAIGLSKNTFTGLIFALFFKDFGEDIRKHATQKRGDIVKVFTDMLGDDGVFLFPTHPTPALYHNESVARPFNLFYTSLVNLLGMPSTSIPLGLGSEGLPIGIQVVANYGQDRLCFAVAEELERAFGGWVEPQKA